MEHRATNLPILNILVIILLALLLGACEEQAIVTRPHEFNHDGISFKYPANWKIQDDLENPAGGFVVVTSPGNSTFVLQVYDANNAWDLDDYASTYYERAKTQIPLGSAENIRRSTVERLIDGQSRKGIYERYDVRVAGSREAQIVEIYRIRMRDKVYFLVSSMPDENLEQVSPGFDLIFSSFDVDRVGPYDGPDFTIDNHSGAPTASPPKERKRHHGNTDATPSANVE